MSTFEIARLAVKIAGIGVWLIALNVFTEALPMLGSLSFADDDSRIGLYMSVGPVLLTGLGALLFFGGGAIARFIAKGAVKGLEQPDLVSERQAIAFSIVGLWVLGRLAVELLSVGLMLSIDGSSDGTKESAIASLKRIALPLLAEISLGTWLLLGSAGVVRIYRRFQSMGLRRSETSPAVPFDFRVTQWQAISFSIVGVAFIAKALSGAISIASMVSLFANSGFDSLPSLIEPLIGCLLNLLFGLFLFVRAQRIANWWARLRADSPEIRPSVQ